MVLLAPGIVVNGVKISPEQINFEVQYHPAATLEDARYAAMQALVIRELLLQRAAETGVGAGSPASSPNEDDLIESLLEAEVSVPDPSEEECLRYYQNNLIKFVSSPLFEVSHILYLAPPEDKDLFLGAQQRAEKTLEILILSPERFAKIAEEESACSSRECGGHLGQISRGQTLPKFEQALFQMKEGEISASPVASEVGYHIIKVHKRAEGQQMTFDMVREPIATYLKDRSWQSALNQYLQLLAGRAKISGFRMKAADQPLVQ